MDYNELLKSISDYKARYFAMRQIYDCVLEGRKLRDKVLQITFLF